MNMNFVFFKTVFTKDISLCGGPPVLKIFVVQNTLYRRIRHVYVLYINLTEYWTYYHFNSFMVVQRDPSYMRCSASIMVALRNPHIPKGLRYHVHYYDHLLCVL